MNTVGENLIAARNIIKEQLVVNGAISSITAANQNRYYNTLDTFNATNYNCNTNNEKRDHAITIVGWDDNYSRNNFAEGAKPSTDGAYIVLNSYGASNFNNGYLYISYEDYFIESELYGVQSTSKIDYDKIYQHDFYGGVFQIGTDVSSEGYLGTTFKREASDSEILKYIGINLASYARLEIYVNPNGTSMDNEELVKVGETDILSSGYHRIDINSTKLNSDEFAVVIKQITNSEGFSFRIESKIDGTAFEKVESDGKCYFSMDGNYWEKLSDAEVSGVDMKSADLCIKAFSVNGGEIGTPEQPDIPNNPDKPENPNPEVPEQPVENEFNVSDYSIKEQYMMNICYLTKKVDFLKKIKTNMNITICTEDDKEITNDEEIIRTGMKLKLSNGTVYILIVRGDINKDGNLTLTDISKLILHYNGNKGFELTDSSMLKACDLNFDGEITLTDISQSIITYNSIEEP